MMKRMVLSLPNIIKTRKVANHVSIKSFRLPLESLDILDILDILESGHLQSLQFFQNFQSPTVRFSLQKTVSPIGECAILPMERRRSCDDAWMLAAKIHVKFDAPAGLVIQFDETVFDDEWLCNHFVPPII